MIDYIIFFLTCFGLGFIIDLTTNWKPDIIKGIVMRFGVGLALMPILGVFFNLVHIPISWISFLMVSLMIFVSALGLRKKQLIPNLKIKWQPLVILVLCGITAFTFISGEYVAPWFADSDPWEYAESAKFIGLERTYDSPYYFSHFVDPYPQGYNIVMGTIYQLNGSIYDTLKIFHSLIISLAVIFFFYFVLRLSDNYNIALLSSIFLWATPAFFSHFIFALSFNITIGLVFLYSLLRRWKIVSSLLYASLLVTHFYTAVIITIFFLIIYLSRVVILKKFCKSYLQIGFFGIILSLAFWIPAYLKYLRWDMYNSKYAQIGGLVHFVPHIEKIGILFGFLIALYFTKKYWFDYVKKALNYRKIIYAIAVILFLAILIIPDEIKKVGGSGTRVYTISDFFIAQGQGLFNSPVGIGLVIMILFTLGIILSLLSFKKLFERDNLCLFTTLNLAIFSLMGVLGASLSIGFAPFRMWVFFAMPCTILAGITLSNISSIVRNKWLVLGIIVLVCTGVYFTSWEQKHELNTSGWPEHKVMSPNSILIYTQSGVEGSALLGMCHPPFVTSAYDFDVRPWVDEELGFYYKTAFDDSLENNNKMYKKYNISYVVIDVGCFTIQKHTMEEVNQKVVDMAESKYFSLVKVMDESVLFKVI